LNHLGKSYRPVIAAEFASAWYCFQEEWFNLAGPTLGDTYPRPPVPRHHGNRWTGHAATPHGLALIFGSGFDHGELYLAGANGLPCSAAIVELFGHRPDDGDHGGAANDSSIVVRPIRPTGRSPLACPKGVLQA
jgi:hypothetical protein